MTRTYIELLIGTMIWGCAFPLTKWALEGMGPVLNTALRFGIAFIFLDLIFRSGFIKNSKPVRYQMREFIHIMKPGFFLFAMLTLQTWGLKYTSPTRSGFITVFYVMFVPFFERVIQGTRLRGLLALWILMAIVGTGLICGVITSHGLDPNFLGAINVGDIFTFFCAICGAAHIIAVDHALKKVESPVNFHVYQCIWITLFALVLTCFTEGFGALSPSVHWSGLTWLGLMHLGVLSSGIAFLIQIRCQQKIPPTRFGLLVLLESPWALIFSVLLGMEVLSGFQIIGAAMILAAAVLESLTAAKPNQNIELNS